MEIMTVRMDPEWFRAVTGLESWDPLSLQRCAMITSSTMFALAERLRGEITQPGHGAEVAAEALVRLPDLPDYAVEMNGDTVTFRNREALDTVEAIEAEPERPYIDPEGFHDAKSVAPGYDVYALYDQWVSWWIDSGRPELKSPRAAFIGFCRNKHKTAPLR